LSKSSEKKKHITSIKSLTNYPLDAPKVGTINEQVRGELAGTAPHLDPEAIDIKHATCNVFESSITNHHLFVHIFFSFYYL
jgi:hypothetical protein